MMLGTYSRTPLMRCKIVKLASSFRLVGMPSYYEQDAAQEIPSPQISAEEPWFFGLELLDGAWWVEAVGAS